MWWIIPAMIALFLSVINPYVGLFCTFNFAAIIIIFSYDVNVKSRITMYQLTESEINYNKSASRLSVVWIVTSVILTLIECFVTIVIWLLASGYITGKAKMVTPINLIPDNLKYSVSLYLMVASVCCNIISLILIFFRKRYFNKLKNEIRTIEKDEEEKLALIDYRPNWLTLSAIVVTSAFAAYISFVPAILHLFYFLMIAVLKIIIAVSKIGNKNEVRRNLNANMLYKLKCGNIFNSIIIAIVVFLAFIICLSAVILRGSTNLVVSIAFILAEVVMCSLIIVSIRNIGRDR